MLQDANNWLDAHKILVFSLSIPLVSAVVAFFSSRYATNRVIASQRTERNLQRVLKLAEFRQDWINELRLEFAQYLGVLCGSHPLSKEEMNRFSLIFNKILLRMNHFDPDYQKLTKAMSKALKGVSNEPKQGNVSTNSDLTVLMGQILKREWNRLKEDLRESESGGGLV